ncbi:MAG: aminotransferase class V-fold PLP-dependent enzyme [bacterium]
MIDPITKKAPEGDSKRDFLKELRVRPVINGAGTYTMLTGALMRPELLQAMESVSQRFVRLDDLHDAVGSRIASLLECEAAMVTSGAFGSLTLGTAACMTGTNPEFIRRLPDTAGMKSEVIIQRSHRFPYDHAVRNCGVRLIEVDTRGDLERAINARTAMMLFLNKAEPDGYIGAAEFVEIGRKNRVPTFNDVAADVPPVDNLFKYTKMGFDLVAFSGGKGIQGPQGAGLLLGRGDLIEAARLNTAPHSDAIGRGLKVSKEETVAMMVAVELYLERDHQADWREWEARIEAIGSSLSALEGVATERFIPAIANQVPHLRIRWDQQIIGISPSDVIRRLREGDPSIELIPVPYEKDSLEVASWTLQPGDAEIVAQRLRHILGSA